MQCNNGDDDDQHSFHIYGKAEAAALERFLVLLQLIGVK